MAVHEPWLGLGELTDDRQGTPAYILPLILWKEALGQVSLWLGEEAAEANSDGSSHPKLWDILEEGALFQNIC